MIRMNAVLAEESRSQYFNKITIETGVNRLIIISLEQCRAHCREIGTPANLNNVKRKISGLGINHYFNGTVILSIPIPKLGLICDITFHILEENVKTLLSLHDLIQTGIYVIVWHNCVHFMGKVQSITVENDFLIYHWTPGDVLFTYGGLLKIHKSFGYPSFLRSAPYARLTDGKRPPQKCVLPFITSQGGARLVLGMEQNMDNSA